MSNTIHHNTNTSQSSLNSPEILRQHGYSDYLQLLGEGSNGKTYKAKDLKTRQFVAIKELKFSENLKNYELFDREAETLKSIHTPGTPVFYEYITNQKAFTECWLVQEYVDGKSILDHMEEGIEYDELQTLNMMLQIADIIRMLQTMYSPAIIHRDIKPSNILVRTIPKDNMDLCLIDFGAVANPERRNVNSTIAGTVGYMAPEQLIGDCTIQSDYYALGATALHMMSRTVPSDFPSDGFNLQFKDQLKKCCPSIHQETIELLQTLLAPQPTDRPQNAGELIELITKTLKTVQASIDKAVESSLFKKRIKDDFGTPLAIWTLPLINFLPTCAFFGTIILIFVVVYNLPVEIHNAVLSQTSLGILSGFAAAVPIIAVTALTHLLTSKLKLKLNAFTRPDNIVPPTKTSLKVYQPALNNTQLNPDSQDKLIQATVAAIWVNTLELIATIDHQCYVFFSTMDKDDKTKYEVGDILYYEKKAIQKITTCDKSLFIDSYR